MQTYLPSPDYHESASILDTKTLGKQRIDTLDIMRVLITGEGFKDSPAILIWQGYEASLLDYQYAVCFEWHIMRAYEDTCLKETIDLFYKSPWLREDKSTPWWLGLDELHLSHQSNLLKTNPEYYEDMFPKGLRDDLPYYWPTDI